MFSRTAILQKLFEMRISYKHCNFSRYEFGELIFGGAYTWRGLFSEFYGIFAFAPLSLFIKFSKNFTTR